MMDAAAQKKREEQEVIEKREKDLAAKFAKVAIWKKELKDKLNKKVAEAQAAKVIISCFLNIFSPSSIRNFYFIISTILSK